MKIKKLPEEENIVNLDVGDVIYSNTFYYMVIEARQGAYGLVCMETGRLQLRALKADMENSYFVDNPNKLVGDDVSFKVVTGDLKVTL